MKTAKKKMIFILGMHRSGTSAATRLMNILGAALPETLLPPEPHINEKGYFEDKDVVVLNEAILSHFHTAWYDITPLSETWWKKEEMDPFREKIRDILKQNYAPFDLTLIKDPRLCLLLPLWREETETLFQPFCVIVLRRPEEVAASLAKRDGLDHGYSYYLWMRYVLSALSFTLTLKRTFVTFEQIVSDPCQVAGHLAHQLGLTWPETLENKKEILSQGILRELKHHAFETNGGETGNGLLALALDIYDKLLSPDPDAHNDYFLKIQHALDNPDDPVTRALIDSLENTNRRMIEKTKKMMALGEMHSHALDVVAGKDRTISAQDQVIAETQKQLEEQNQVIIEKDLTLGEQNRTITTLRQFRESIISHWAWPIMRRLPAKGVNFND